MKRKSRVLDFYASKSWAILEANLQEMFQIYQSALERKSLEQEFDPQALAAKVGKPLDNARTITVRDGIAVLPVSGPIFRYANLFTEISGATSIEVLATDFRQALEDRSIRAIILEINSPGGEVDGTSELAQHIFEARGKKPIIAYVSHLGASAAYWLASACDEIVCNDTASLGSIGVVGTVRLSKDKNLLEFVSSQSPNKRPDPATEGGRNQIQRHIDDLAQVFIDTVARNRGMTAESVIEDGSAGGLSVGHHAVTAGLADRIGSLEGLINELSDTSKPFTFVRAENLKKSTVLQTGADTEATLTTGANAMPDIEKKTAKDDAKPAEPAKQESQGSNDAKDAKATKSEVEMLKEQLAASEKKAADKDTQLAEEQKKTSALGDQVQTLQSSVSELQRQARETRFTEMAKGWPGEPKTHIAMLEHLAQSEGGESSELFKAYVTQQKAASEQLKQSKLLDEIGSSAPAEGSADALIQAKAKELQAADPSLTPQQAFDKAWTGNPELAKQYREEQARSVN